MTDINNNEEMFMITLDEIAAKRESTPAFPTFDGVTPIGVEDAKKYFLQRAKFFLNRLDRAINRRTPELYDEDGSLNMDIERFQADLKGLLYAQENRAAIESTMLSGEKVEVSIPHSSSSTIFKKIDEETLLIHAESKNNPEQ